MSIHDGHRERLKRQFREHGLDVLNDHSVLELLLFYSIPRQDTNALAHLLMDRFGSLDAVFSATEEELLSVPGLGESSVTLLKLLPAIERRRAMDRAAPNTILNSVEAAGAYLTPRFINERDEVLYVVCLDSKHKVICCKELSRGVVNTVDVSIRKISELALAKNASGVILAHNHVSGVAVPSQEDIQTTRHILNALRGIGISLVDHLVVAGDDYVSMKDSQFL